MFSLRMSFENYEAYLSVQGQWNMFFGTFVTR